MGPNQQFPGPPGPQGMPMPQQPYPPLAGQMPYGPPPQGMPLPPGSYPMPGPMMPASQQPPPYPYAPIPQGAPIPHGMPMMQHGMPMQQGPNQMQAPMPPSNPNSTQNVLQIAEIRDGIVILSDGSYRAVVMVKSINFDLMSPQEREAVEFSYQGFLNSLYFPIQIYIRSQKVDIRPYIQKLDKIRSEHDNMLLALLMEDYIDFMTDLAYQTNIMNKRFYIVLPFFTTPDAQKVVESSKSFLTGIFGTKEQRIIINEPELEKAKAELRNRVQATLNGLMQCGVQGLPLDTQELIELYYDYYNPDTAPRQPLKNFDDMTAPVVTKGQGQAMQPGLDREMY